jgi:hypothetical protein
MIEIRACTPDDAAAVSTLLTVAARCGVEAAQNPCGAPFFFGGTKSSNPASSSGESSANLTGIPA